MKNKWFYFEKKNIGNNSIYIEKIINKGYFIRYCYDDARGLRDLTIEVYNNDKRVGWANFSENDFEINVNNIEVNCTHQNRGVGTAIFVLAKYLLGKNFHDIWGVEKSEKAKMFWHRKQHIFR